VYRVHAVLVGIVFGRIGRSGAVALAVAAVVSRLEIDTS